MVHFVIIPSVWGGKRKIWLPKIRLHSEFLIQWIRNGHFSWFVRPIGKLRSRRDGKSSEKANEVLRKCVRWKVCRRNGSGKSANKQTSRKLQLLQFCSVSFFFFCVPRIVINIVWVGAEVLEAYAKIQRQHGIIADGGGAMFSQSPFVKPRPSTATRNPRRVDDWLCLLSVHKRA